MGFVSSINRWVGARGTCAVIREVDSEDVCQVDDGLVFRVIDLGSSDICLNAVDLFVRPLMQQRYWCLEIQTGYDKVYPQMCPHSERLRRAKLLM
jgi:hypothetical protein